MTYKKRPKVTSKLEVKNDLKIAGLATKEILLSLVDLTTPFFLPSSIYHHSVKKYLEQRDIDRSNFLDRVRYLKRKGYIKTFTENKEKYIELTKKGLEHTKYLFLDEIIIKRPKKWDGNWRVVIFDVPEEQRHSRDLFRNTIMGLGFVQIQKSVYVYPFECTAEITTICDTLGLKDDVTILVADIIQGEEDITDHFYETEVLHKSDIKV